MGRYANDRHNLDQMQKKWQFLAETLVNQNKPFKLRDIIGPDYPLDYRPVKALRKWLDSHPDIHADKSTIPWVYGPATTPVDQLNPPKPRRERPKRVYTDHIHILVTSEEKALYKSLGGCDWFRAKLKQGEL